MSAWTPVPWRVGCHPRDDSGTSWRAIMSDGEFGPMYVGQALCGDADRIVAAVKEWPASRTLLRSWRGCGRARRRCGG